MPGELTVAITQFAAAAVIGAVVTALLVPIARKTGAMSLVRDDRWHQGGAIPRLAGPAIVMGVAPWIEAELVAVLAGFCLIGVIDDIRHLEASTKGLLLLAPSALAGYITGEAWVTPACWIAANAVNLLDHADGLAGSVSFASLLVAGGALGFAGAGVCAGFLLHNFPPARAFLGDGGSYTLGGLLVLAWYDYGLFPVMIGMAIPLIDSLVVILRRFLARRPPWQGGTDHTGHILLRNGLPPKALALLYGGLAGGIALIGVGIAS